MGGYPAAEQSECGQDGGYPLRAILCGGGGRTSKLTASQGFRWAVVRVSSKAPMRCALVIAHMAGKTAAGIKRFVGQGMSEQLGRTAVDLRDG